VTAPRLKRSPPTPPACGRAILDAVKDINAQVGRVGAAAAGKPVDASQAEDLVVARPGVNPVVPLATNDHIIPEAADHEVIAGAGVDRGRDSGPVDANAVVPRQGVHNDLLHLPGREGLRFGPCGTTALADDKVAAAGRDLDAVVAWRALDEQRAVGECGGKEEPVFHRLDRRKLHGDLPIPFVGGHSCTMRTRTR